MISRCAWQIVVCAIVAAFAFVLLVINYRVSHAEWKAEYSNQPPEIRAWFHNAETTPAVRERLGFTKCCDHSDVVHTRFSVSKVNGDDEWFYEDTPGHWKRIPPDVIHWNERAPGGKPTLFIYMNLETCFYPGDSGI